MSTPLQLAPSVRDLRGIAIEAIANRLARIDLTPLLVYNLGTVPAAVLPYLAWQFDVLSPLWQLLAPANPGGVEASAIPQRRALIQNGIAYHAKCGVPGTIKRALASLGYPGATILEGQSLWGGTQWSADEGWAACRILLPLSTVSVNPDEIAPWAPGIAYPAGALASYLGFFLYANGLPTPGVPPIFTDIDSVTDIDEIDDIDDLVTAPWTIVSWEFGEPITLDDVTLIEQVFEFFGNERSWLDSVWFVLPPMTDSAPVPTDTLTLGGVSEFISDTAPAPSDSLGTMTIAMPAMAENYPAIAPLQNNHFRQKGHTQGANEPLVADSVITINGVVDGTSS